MTTTDEAARLRVERAEAARIEAEKADRSRRWVREYRTAMKNMGSGWAVDGYGQPVLVNRTAGGKMKKIARKTSTPKQKVKKERLELVS
jgi:hypothetical protein